MNQSQESTVEYSIFSWIASLNWFSVKNMEKGLFEMKTLEKWETEKNYVDMDKQVKDAEY